MRISAELGKVAEKNENGNDSSNLMLTVSTFSFVALVLLLVSSSFLPTVRAFSNGTSASLVEGQGNFTTGSCNQGSTTATANGLCLSILSSFVAFDSAQNLWVSDSANNRILRYPAPLSSDETANLVIGQASTSGTNQVCSSTSQSSLCHPAGITFDSAGNLWVADFTDSRVLEFASPILNDETASEIIGQPSSTTNDCNHGGISATSLCNPTGVTFDSTGNLWVSEYNNHRVLEFPKTGSTIATMASFVLGQPNFTSNSCATSSICSPTSTTFDSSGNLWVVNSGDNLVEEHPLTMGGGISTSATIRIGGCTAASLPQAFTLCAPWDARLDSAGNLWVTDADFDRVLEFATPLSTGESASIVLGKPDFTSSSTTCAVTASNLCNPYGLSFDSQGNLWVVDTFNNRVLEFLAPVVVVPDLPFGSSGIMIGVGGTFASYLLIRMFIRRNALKPISNPSGNSSSCTS